MRNPTWTAFTGDRAAHAYLPDSPGSTALCSRSTGYVVARADPVRPDVVDTYGLCQRCVGLAERLGLLRDSRPGLFLKAFSLSPEWVEWRHQHPKIARRIRVALTRSPR